MSRPSANTLPPDDSATEAFVAQITAHQTAILAFLLSMVPNRSDAEDLLQKTNLTLWRKQQSFEPGTNFRAWAFSVARWEARSFAKERARKSWLVFNDEVANIISERLASIPDHSMEASSEALGNCLAKLSPKNRDLVIDRYQRGLSFRECAKKTGRKEGGLRVTLHRIRESLRVCMQRQLRKITP